MSQAAVLALEDGSVFHGLSVGVSGRSVGEVVFNTALTGYQEILTDPSYCQQLVTLTYPHIGNVGTTPEDEEAAKIFASGLIVKDVPLQPSNWRSTRSLPEYLAERGVVAISDIDTRRLTRLLRDKGAQRGSIVAGEKVSDAEAVALACSFAGLEGADLAKVVSVKEPYTWSEGLRFRHGGKVYEPQPDFRAKIVAYDFGVKRNILRLLVELGCQLTVVPAQTSAAEVLAMRPDGVFLSNGPGDPGACVYAIEAIRQLVESGVPTFGICLGHQLLALACGGRTVKMKFGHHGANHPVQDLDNKQVLITSQNHGFAVDEASLPSDLRVTHRSLFDGTVQGIHHRTKPAFSFQGHPEASPGPHDLRPLFLHFTALIHNART